MSSVFLCLRLTALPQIYITASNLGISASWLAVVRAKQTATGALQAVPLSALKLSPGFSKNNLLLAMDLQEGRDEAISSDRSGVTEV